jgi:hypothetical protein
MEMSKVMRQMLEQSGRVGVAHGEAVRDPISDETCEPLHEHRDTGSVKLMAGTGGLLENSRRWWRNSAKLLNSVLTIAYFDNLGLPRLS